MRKVLLLLVLIVILVIPNVYAKKKRPCIDPLSTVDWEFYIDSFDIDFSDICTCLVNGELKIGTKWTIFEPVGFIEVVKEAFQIECLDARLEKTLKNSGSNYDEYNVKRNVHYIKYPVFSVLGAVMDYICVSDGQLDIGTLSEVDPIHNDDRLRNIIFIDRLLYNNPVAMAICLEDCVQSTVSEPNNALYWCGGCWGTFVGAETHSFGKDPVVEAGLLALSEIDFLHYTIQFGKTSEASGLSYIIGKAGGGSSGSSLCRPVPFLRAIKSQYRLNLAYPVAGDVFKIGQFATWSWFRQYPTAENFVFTVWRKRDCCGGISIN